MGKKKQRRDNSGPHCALVRSRRRRFRRGPGVEAKLSTGDETKVTSEAFRAEMERLREERKKEKDDLKRIEMAKAHERIKKEYSKWQDDLCWLIRHQSRIEVRPSGEASYILPKELVRLVWETTIAQRVAVEKAKGLDSMQAMGAAMDGLSAEVAAMAEKVKGANEKPSQGAEGG